METPLIPREVLFGDPERIAAGISPDGRSLAYLAPRDGVLNVWVRSMKGRDDRPVTDDRLRGIHHYCWAPDASTILYLQDRDGDENWRIYAVALEDARTSCLTPQENVQAQIIHIDPRFPDRILIALNLRDKRYHDVYHLHIPDGKTGMEVQNDGTMSAWCADDSLSVRAALASLPDGRTRVLVRSSHDSPWETLVEWEPGDSFSDAVAFAPGSSSIYLLDSSNANSRRLTEVSLKTGRAKVLLEDPSYDVMEVFLERGTRKALAAALLKERLEWVALDESVSRDFQRLKEAHPGDFRIISADRANNLWVMLYEADDGPISYYMYNRATGVSEFLFVATPDLERYKLARMEPVSFVARDGLEVHGYLTLPAGQIGGRVPLVLNVHGGPWYRDTWGYNPEVQWLANRGYACLQINFRGSLGYGKKFQNAGDREWGRKMHYDLLDGLRWAFEKGVADPDRVAIYGWSYGGYAALIGATFTPEFFRCAVSACGPSNLITFLNTIPPYWETFRGVMDLRIGAPGKDAEFLMERSPISRADKISIPLLVGQGANDPRVRKEESDRIVEAAKNAGKDVEYLIFPDEGHGLYRPENRLRFYAAVERFLAKHLGGRYEP